MNKPIEVGDLVQVVHSCCDKFVVYPTFVVQDLTPTGDFCFFCSTSLPPGMSAGDPHRYGYPVQWLRRIPPLSELASEPRREEQPA